jgi:hypothetical protein
MMEPLKSLIESHRRVYAKDITQVLCHKDTKARRILGTDFADYTDSTVKKNTEDRR